MPNPAYQAPKNPQIWTSYWHRAAQEEIGVVIHCDNPAAIHEYIAKAKPHGFSDYTLARGPDPAYLYIIRPGVTLDV